MQLTVRDLQIVRTLSLKVRIFSLPQLASAWWRPTKAGQDNARRRLRVVCEAGLLQCTQVMARPLPAIETPVVTWTPGEPEPDFGSASWLLQSRWTEPPRQTTVYLATKKGGNRFGAPRRGELKLSLQATHDLGVSEVYLQLLRADPEAASQWVGEDAFASSRRGQKLPDAMLVAGSGEEPRMVIEFGGAYARHRLESLHRDCQARNLPYQLW